MNRTLLLAGLFGVLQFGSSCHKDADEVRPANFDELALANGHWEWEYSSYQAGPKTPATIGFTRQLVFGAGGSLTVRRSGQADYHTPYQLSMGTPQPCGTAQPVPLITYTSEQDIGNTPVKLYQLSQRNGQQTLTISGEALCVDGGAYEAYHWVSE